MPPFIGLDLSNHTCIRDASLLRYGVREDPWLPLTLSTFYVSVTTDERVSLGAFSLG